MNESIFDVKLASRGAARDRTRLLMGFPQHGIAVAIRSAQQKKCVAAPGRSTGHTVKKIRPAANQRFANMAGEANVGLRGGGGVNKTDVELKSG